jgi:hypothetical protein
MKLRVHSSLSVLLCRIRTIRPASFLVQLLGAMMLTALPTLAGAPAVDCRRPFVFSSADVNFVVLPYTNSVSRQRPLSLTSARLTLMIQTDAIFAILKYGNVGAVRLVVGPQDAADCQPDTVAAKLTGDMPGAEATIMPGHGLVLFWGRLYEENGDIYVQSFARFLRRGLVEDLSFSLGKAKYVGRMANQSVAFAPRKLTSEDVSEIAAEFQRIAIVREEPRDDSPGLPMPVEPNGFGTSPFTYTVLEAKNDWMRIEAKGLGPSGWIHGGGDFGSIERQRMPELDFVDGISGYLRYREAVEGSAKEQTSFRTVSWAEDALRRYEEAADSKQAPVALAAAKTAHGLLEMLGPLSAASKEAAALQLFQDASDLTPYSGDARNLELIVRWRLAYKGGGPGLQPATIADGFVQAAVLAPDDPDILLNLQNVYQWLLAQGPRPGVTQSGELDNQELSHRLEALQLVIARR